MVRIERDGQVFAQVYGQAHRDYDIPSTVGTRFAIANGGKGLTALAV
ncbi:hypothetical protein SAMN04488074_1108 [Lentzea albidocapillata subsp. violacea]|uniref:Beta-lactamase n=1 Tax=Lentzea albidocapillata subsp. violacea TaxID=128104 RepID=A0A1G9IPQ4_9PSEU|nr:beta-lactamase family protein [Lentzea albidocapillata]SDL27238.1 hypothetical protein SAMN04488074_1108 [Lentzea albidocapillata subsp. violacea]